MSFCSSLVSRYESFAAQCTDGEFLRDCSLFQRLAFTGWRLEVSWVSNAVKIFKLIVFMKMYKISDDDARMDFFMQSYRIHICGNDFISQDLGTMIVNELFHDRTDET